MGGSASVDSNPHLSLTILSAKYLPKVLIRLFHEQDERHESLKVPLMR